MEKGVSKNEPSKIRLSFLPSLHVGNCEVRHKCRNKYSSQHGNVTARLSCFFPHCLFNIGQMFRDRSMVTSGAGLLALAFYFVAFAY